MGIVIGFKLFPTVISNAYSMMYIQPPLETVFWWNYAVIIILIAIACTTAATLFACVEQLSEKPASLMLPRAPKAGKRILLERIGFIWSRMKFTHKVTARNIFRYKKRFFMTVFGIAGCCALLVTGFGLRDSIGDIVNKQFNELYKYNLLLYLENDGDAQNDKIVNDFLNNSNYVESYAEIHSESGYIESDGESKSVEIYVPKNTSQLTEQINLRIRKTGEPVPFDDDSLVLTEKLCETLGIKIGDTVTVRNIDGENSEFTVSGITENYVTAYAFMSESVYREIFGKAPEYSNVLITLTDEADEMRDDISSQLLESDNVMYIQFSSAIEESFTNSLKKIDYIVVVLILAAGALAVIVMYNLTNINICERKKELATIKVLGFHEGEVASYIYRETAILSIIGTLAGFVLGIFLHKFVIAASEVDMIMFGREIYPLSYVFSAAVTLMFTVIVDLIMLRKLNSIDMVESMKANE